MSQQQQERKFPSYYIAKLCNFCKHITPTWIEFDYDQKVYVDINTQHKHICQHSTFQYKITDNGYDIEFTEDQAVVARLNRNWRHFI